MKKVIFFGRGIIGETCFERLLNKAGKTYDIVAACSNPDINVWWKSNAIYKKSVKLGIPFISNEDRNEDKILSVIESESVDLMISLQHRWVFSDNLLKTVNYQALNLHNARLPDYKGYCTINHAIINGDQTYTSTIHWIIKEVDQGAIAFEETVPIYHDDTAISLYKKSCTAGVRAFDRLLDCLLEGQKIPRRSIDGQAGRFYKKSDLNEVREIKNPKDIDEMDRKGRGLFFPPFEPAFYRVNGKKIYVLPKNYAPYTRNTDFLNQFSEGENQSKYIVLTDSS